jgi:hypothetical protein
VKVATGELQSLQDKGTLQEHQCKLQQLCGEVIKYAVHGMVQPVGLEQVFAAQLLLDQDIPESQVI